MDRIWVYLAKRVVSLGIVLFLIATFVFFQFFVLSGDPNKVLVPAMGSNQELRDRVVEDLKLNESLPTQYANFMTKVFTGKFFISTGVWKGAPIADGIHRFLPTTLFMFGIVLAAAGILGWILGLVTRVKEDRTISRMIRLVALGSLVTPAIIVAMLVSVYAPFPSDVYIGDAHLANAYILLGGISAAFLASWGMFVLMEKGKDRYFDSLGKDLDGRGKDVYDRGPVAASPTTKMFAAWTLSTVLVCDAVFGNHGLGTYLWDSIMSRDPLLQMSIVVVIAAIAAFTNFTLDVVSPFLKNYVSKMPRGSPAPVDDSGPSDSRSSVQSSEPPLLTIAGLRSFVRSFLRLRLGVCALAMLMIFLVIAVLSPFISTVDDPWNDREPDSLGDPRFYDDDQFNPLPPSLAKSALTGFVHPFGTDAIGRDIYSLTLQGTRSALIVTALVAGVSLIAGFLTWTIILILKRSNDTLEKILGGTGSVVADAALAIPTLVILFLAPVLRQPPGWSSIYPIILFSALFSFAIAIKNARTVAPKGSNLRLSRLFPKAIPNVIHASKFVIVGAFLALFAFESLVHSDLLGVEVTWSDIINGAFEQEAVARGAWWCYTFPTIFTVLFLGSVFVFFDSLEITARRRWSALGPGACEILAR